jgi:hypothetical protein
MQMRSLSRIFCMCAANAHNSLLAYRRTWLKIIAWAAAEGLVLETFPAERVGEFYEEATRGRSASHHLQAQ